MSRYPARRKSPYRYVRFVLEELEWRCVPALLGVQIELPLSGILSPQALSVGLGTAPTPAPTTISLLAITTTSTPAMASPGTTTISPAPGSMSFTFTPATPGGNSSFAPVSGSSAAASQPPASASSASGTGVGPANSSSAFPGSAPAAAVPGLAIQASPAISSTILGGAASGVNFELLGNLPSLLGTANVFQGTSNTALSTSSLAGAPLAGSVFFRPDLFTGRTTGETTAFGLSHPAPGDREEVLPEQFLIPPDRDWFEPIPQNIEQTLPSGNAFLPAGLPRAVNAPIFDAPPAELPQGVMFSEEDAGMSDEDEQPPEERDAMSAAIAIISFGVGAYWTVRDRRVRRVAAELPVIDAEM